MNQDNKAEKAIGGTGSTVVNRSRASIKVEVGSTRGLNSGGQGASAEQIATKRSPEPSHNTLPNQPNLTLQKDNLK